MRSPASMDRPGIIYLAVCRVNLKAYVGRTTGGFSKRTSEHKYDAARKKTRQLFHRAVAEFSYDSFDFALLERCDAATLKERETYWIEYFSSREPDGYNVSLGPGILGVKRTPQFVAMMRDLMTGKPKTEEHKAKLRVPKSPEHIANASKSRQSTEYKKRASDGQIRAWGTRSRTRQSENTKLQWDKWRTAREATKNA